MVLHPPLMAYSAKFMTMAAFKGGTVGIQRRPGGTVSFVKRHQVASSPELVTGTAAPRIQLRNLLQFLSTEAFLSLSLNGENLFELTKANSAATLSRKNRMKCVRDAEAHKQPVEFDQTAFFIKYLL